MKPRATTAADTRRRFAARVAAGEPTLVPLCLDPLTARLAERAGFAAGYVSGGALGYALAVSEALLSVEDLARATAAVARRSDLALVVDGGVGFGDPVHVTRTVWDLEAAGAAAVELEDQVAPKRVSHHRGVEHLVPLEEMAAKIRTAAAARQDPNLLLVARTGAVRHEGVDAACDRARAYVDAGADVILLSPPGDADVLARVREAAAVPLATIAALDGAADLLAAGVGVVIDPLTPHVVAYRATKELFARHAAGEASGLDRAEVRRLYGELAEVGGFEELYDIERATTEPGT